MQEKKSEKGTEMDPSKVKIGFVSLGCPKNQVDLERMLALVEKAGFQITGEEIDADVIVVNTCAFIDSAIRESIDSILDLGYLKEHRSLRGVIVTGCLAERYKEELQKELPEADAVLGVGGWNEIVNAIEAVLAGEKYTCFPEKNLCPMEGERLLVSPPYTAYMKIAEGCDNCCSYCTIPKIRGRYRSREMELLLEEAKILERSGTKELILVAQDVTKYGTDLYGKSALPALLRRLTEETEIPWIRILYCYPEEITDELIAVMGSNPRILPYIDLPIQHISDAVLERMNRRGGSGAIRDAIRRLREGVPSIVIRSTAIAGFPGETVAAHTELCRFLKEAKFERFGVFPYSREEGTPAASLPRQISEEKKAQRAEQLMDVQREISAAWLATRVGKTETVLVEGYDPAAETWYGRTAADAPEIDGKLYIPGKKSVPKGTKPGDFLTVRVTESMDYDLLGEVIG